MVGRNYGNLFLHILRGHSNSTFAQKGGGLMLIKQGSFFVIFLYQKCVALMFHSPKENLIRGMGGNERSEGGGV